MCRLSYFLHRPPRFSAARRLRYTMSTSAASKNMQTPLPLHLSRQTKKSPTDLPITSSHLISPNLPSSSPVRPSSSSSASAPTYPYLRTSRPSLPPSLPSSLPPRAPPPYLASLPAQPCLARFAAAAAVFPLTIHPPYYYCPLVCLCLVSLMPHAIIHMAPCCPQVSVSPSRPSVPPLSFSYPKLPVTVRLLFVFHQEFLAFLALIVKYLPSSTDSSTSAMPLLSGIRIKPCESL